MELKHIVSSEEANTKVAKILLHQLKISNRLLNKLKMNEKILVNGTPVFSNYIVHEGDCITVFIDFMEEDDMQPEKMNIEILYEDEYFLAVNKPAGMVVHPCSYHPSHTLANGVKYYLSNHKKIRAINRLDKDTSGIVLFAKNEYIQELMIKEVSIKKEYIAIASGILEDKIGTIRKPIKRKEESIMEREVSEEGQTAITHFEVMKEFTLKEKEYKNDGNGENQICISNEAQYMPCNSMSVLKLRLETGRTHQIRVHLAYLGNPILGDTLYGKESRFIARQALHAHRLHFQHPITKSQIEIQAPIPNDMQRIIKNEFFLENK